MVSPAQVTTINLIAGASLGMLVGLLLGLSVSNVVGAAVGALTAVLGAFFGLAGGKDDTPAPSGRPLRIAAFALFCIAGIFLGIQARTSGILSPSHQESLDRWKAIGVAPETALDLVMFERLGLVPQGYDSVAQPQSLRQEMSALFAGEAAEACGNLDNPLYQDTQALLGAMAAEGGEWKSLAETVRNHDPTVPVEILISVVRLVCR